MSEKPGRYERSTAGLTGAMIVTVGFVIVFVAWRALFREDVEPVIPPVEWRESVELADSAGMAIARPSELPAGWTATSVDLRAGDDPSWALGMLTDEGDFVGIRQADVSVAELVHTYVDKEATAGPDAEVDSSISTVWQTWSDSGGDVGYSTESGDDALLVYGSAPAEDVEQLVSMLTVP